MPNILSVDSSFMKGNARVQEWAEKFLAKWTEPLDEVSLVLWWHSQPQEIHEQLAQMAPEEHARLEQKVNEIVKRKERSTNGTA
jgi:hypothetical protein